MNRGRDTTNRLRYANVAAIYVYAPKPSDFRIRVGDTLENADAQMGITRKTHPNQGQWAGRTFYIYEDGLTIECIGGIVQGAWRDQDK